MYKSYKAIPFKVITHHDEVVDNNEPWENHPAYDTTETRFCIVDANTGEMLDDAQGYGYKTAQKATKQHRKHITLIRKVRMDCPLCDRTHEVEERKRFSTVTIRGEKITYEERFYRCTNSNDEENEFETGSMVNENLSNARSVYRAVHKIQDAERAKL